MDTYIIPKQDHQKLYIFEGGIWEFSIRDNEFIIMVDCVDYPDLPDDIQKPDYLDIVKVSFRRFSHLRFIFGYTLHSIVVSNVIELGKKEEGNELLFYEGSLCGFSGSNIPAGYMIEIVCQEIELEFLDQTEYRKKARKLGLKVS